MRISDWSSDVCSSDLTPVDEEKARGRGACCADQQPPYERPDRRRIKCESDLNRRAEHRRGEIEQRELVNFEPLLKQEARRRSQTGEDEDRRHRRQEDKQFGLVVKARDRNRQRDRERKRQQSAKDLDRPSRIVECRLAAAWIVDYALPHTVVGARSEEHTCDLQSLMRNSY